MEALHRIINKGGKIMEALETMVVKCNGCKRELIVPKDVRMKEGWKPVLLCEGCLEDYQEELKESRDESVEAPQNEDELKILLKHQVTVLHRMELELVGLDNRVESVEKKLAIILATIANVATGVNPAKLKANLEAERGKNSRLLSLAEEMLARPNETDEDEDE